jgi:hypothetical protein
MRITWLGSAALVPATRPKFNAILLEKMLSEIEPRA